MGKIVQAVLGTDGAVYYAMKSARHLLKGRVWQSLHLALLCFFFFFPLQPAQCLRNTC